MKRALVLLVLLAACSHGTGRAQPTAPASASPTVTVTAPPSEDASPTATASASARPVGPAGTKVPSGFRPRSATFTSDQTGWVLGASPCPSGKGTCDVIARTRDGGTTWRAIPSPPTSPDHLAQIRFADSANGFVTGDQLWATHDGGATWKALAAHPTSTLAAAAGRAWIVTERGLESAAVTNGAFAAERSGTHIYTFAVHGTEVIYGLTDSTSIQTIRHGERPVSHSSPCTSGAAVPVIGPSGHWFVVCEGDAGLGHQDKQAFQSLDAGRTWQSAGQPPAVTGTDSYVTADGTFVVDHQEVAVYRSGSWHVVLSSGGGVSEGGFESAALGYCIGGFDSADTLTMKVTHDAGRTWKTVAF